MSSWRILVPAEHGVWGLVAASALVGLGVSHHLGGLGLLVAAVLLVGARAALLAGSWGWALLAGSAAAGAVLATWRMADAGWLPWLAAAGMVGAVDLWIERWSGPRPWWVVAMAGVAFALLAAAIASAGGANAADAALAALALAVHLIAMVPLVRALIRRGGWPDVALAVHLAGACLLVGLWGAGFAPACIASVGGLGLARAAWVLHRYTLACSPRTIGTRELAYTALVSAIIILGLRWG